MNRSDSQSLQRTFPLAAAVAARKGAGTTQFKIDKSAKGMGGGPGQGTPGGVVGIKPGAQ